MEMQQASGDFEEWVREYTLKALEDWPEETELYANEMPHELCWDAWDRKAAITREFDAGSFIWKHRDEGGAALDWVQEHELCDGLNPLLEPSFFTYWLLLWGVEKILSGCPWNEAHMTRKGHLDIKAKSEITGYIENNHIWF